MTPTYSVMFRAGWWEARRRGASRRSKRFRELDATIHWCASHPHAVVYVHDMDGVCHQKLVYP